MTQQDEKERAFDISKAQVNDVIMLNGKLFQVKKILSEEIVQQIAKSLSSDSTSSN